MKTLFPAEQYLPPGFMYLEDFISKEEEQKLIDAIQQTDLKNMHFQGYEAKRKVANYGFDWSFEKRILSRGTKIPKHFDWLIKRVADFINVQPAKIEELLLTEYPVGAVINWHRDAPPFDVVAGISLLSDCTFKFRPHNKSQRTRKSTISIPVRRRSIYFMKDESRTDWEHSIGPLKTIRYSVTLRTLKSLT